MCYRVLNARKHHTQSASQWLLVSNSVAAGLLDGRKVHVDKRIRLIKVGNVRVVQRIESTEPWYDSARRTANSTTDNGTKKQNAVNCSAATYQQARNMSSVECGARGVAAAKRYGKDESSIKKHRRTRT